MAKQGIANQPTLRSKSKTKGVQAKTKTSKLKTSKLYKKPYRGQGK